MIRSIPMRAMLMAGVLLGGTLAPASAQADDADIYDLMFPVVLGVRQRARQLSLENRRLEFDLDTYIRASTLTPSEERELRRRERVLRALSDPTVTEIRSGSTLNDLLQDAQILRSRGARVEATVWPSHVLRRVNVTAAGSPGRRCCAMRRVTAPAGKSIASLRAPSARFPSVTPMPRHWVDCNERSRASMAGSPSWPESRATVQPGRQRNT